MADSIQLTVNGTVRTVPKDVAVTKKLVDYLRYDLGLTGTNYTCRQGGCGACAVTVTAPDLTTSVNKTFSAYSCLTSLYNCDGWEITTVEGLGNERDGYHPIQEKLVENYGTQCGFCTPGFVMSMHGMTQSKSDWTASDVENCMDGHICRCTGYRSIVTAFNKVTPADIEDADKIICSKKASKGGCCGGQKKATEAGCCRSEKSSRKEITVDGVTWYSPTSVQELQTTLTSLAVGTTFRYEFGGTGGGVFDVEEVDAIISIRRIAELSTITSTTSEFIAGSGVSISSLMEEFDTIKTQTGFEYLGEMKEHWQKIGSTAVRNLGSWAGNLALKIKNPGFASDIFLTLNSSGAEVLVGKTDGSSTWYPVNDLLTMDFEGNKEVMLKLKLKQMPTGTYYKSYKILPRARNAIALVGGSFNLEVDFSAAYVVSGTPILAFSGISSTFNRATNTEAYLVGKSLTSEDVLKAALSTLRSEMVPDVSPLKPDASYIKTVAEGLLYRAFLSILNDSGIIDSSIISAASPLVRPTSTGTQSYDENTATWPLGQPIPKIESAQQCAGEIKYVNDMPALSDELYGYFVQSTKANATIESIDATAALALEGVEAFVTADDIPGINNMQLTTGANVQPLFADGTVSYYGQAIGLIVATSFSIAKKASKLVVVTYTGETTPVITIDQAIKKGRVASVPLSRLAIGDVNAGFAASTHIVEGAMNRDGQFHFHLETQCTRVVPDEGSYEVFATTQWPAGTQGTIAQVLNIDCSKVNVTVKRLGGGFGAKIDMCNLVTNAAALAAYKVRKPVRINLDIQTNMTLVGWREPYSFTYKVGTDDTGKLQAVQYTIYGDSGYCPVDSSVTTCAQRVQSCYECPNWEVTPVLVTTDTAANTWCRTPGTLEAVIFTEYAMEHMANELQMDSLEFKKMNLIPDGGKRKCGTIPVRLQHRMALEGLLTGEDNEALRDVALERNLIGDMIAQIEQEADVAARKVAITDFNSTNRYVKRGLAVMPFLWQFEMAPNVCFGVFIAINQQDGSVVISTGGIEMGQGLNTKVAQVTAFTLGCELKKVVIKPTTVLVGANSSLTGGSTGANSNTYCAQQAAKVIRARLDAVAETGMTYIEKVNKAWEEGVSLCQYYWNDPDELLGYPVYGVACTEVELDVLTGNFTVLQTDLIEDAGTSPSPLIDVGQVEGGFLMGQGLFTTEGPKYDAATGQKLSEDTWDYKPLLTKDIPTDLRVTLLKNAPNPLGVVSSKVTGEPPICLGFVVPQALRAAIASARADAGNTDWFQIDYPMTVDKIHKHCLVDSTQFSYSKNNR